MKLTNESVLAQRSPMQRAEMLCACPSRNALISWRSPFASAVRCFHGVLKHSASSLSASSTKSAATELSRICDGPSELPIRKLDETMNCVVARNTRVREARARDVSRGGRRQRQHAGARRRAAR